MRENYRLNKDIFVVRSNIIHNNKYDYTKTNYKNQRTKVIISCPIHGDFEQTPKNHMSGQGCPKCGKKYAQTHSKYKYQNFIKLSNERFGERYSFPFIENEYENSHSKINIKCNKCGNMFIKIACDHITSPNGGCQHCYHSLSKPEEEIGDFIKTLVDDDITFNDRTILNGYELDIFIPSKKLAIEYNGLFWHSEDKKDKNYHLMKTEMCENKGIHLLQIFEDEYLYNKNILLKKISHILKLNQTQKIYARKCNIIEIDYKTSKEFLNLNHIQGHDKATIYLGCYYNNKLIGVMTFLNNNDNWTLNRFATDINYNVIGVGGKLFQWFVKQYNPKQIKSFADRRWTSTIKPNLYNKLGFVQHSILKPDYRYIFEKEIKRYHKFGFRKKILSKKYNIDNNLTEKQMTQLINARKIWDCGLIKYVWENKTDKNLSILK